MLVVSRAAFNRVTKLLILLPVTSGGNFARMAGFAVSLMGVGLQTTGIVRCDQPRAIDLAIWSGKKLKTVPGAILDEVLARLTPFFE